MTYEPKPGTYGYLWVECYNVTAYCTPCNRVVKVDLEKMPPEQSYINRRWRCQFCHGLGQANLSPDHSPRDSPAAKQRDIERASRIEVLAERMRPQMQKAARRDPSGFFDREK